MIAYTVSTTQKKRSFYINLANIDPALCGQILSADILFIPYESPDCPDAFTLGTQTFFHFCKQYAQQNSIDICCNDADYKEIELNSRLTRLGSFYVKQAVLPIILGAIGSYITQLYPLEPITPTEETRPYLESPKIQFSITLENNDSTNQDFKKIEFEGTAQDFKSIEKELKDLAN